MFVHDYVTAGGRRLSKSSAARLDPFDLASRYGVDALRWWCVRDVPRSGDVDFREELLAARADELANQLGNLIARSVALVARSRPAGLRGGAPPGAADELLERAPAAIDAALGRFDLRTAAGAAWEIVTEANRCGECEAVGSHTPGARDGLRERGARCRPRRSRSCLRDGRP